MGLIDDAPEKAHVQLYHVRVLGQVEQLSELILQTGSRVVVVAVAEPAPRMLRQVQEIAAEHDVQVKVIPPLHDLLERGVRPTDLRDISIDDLLGRDVDTNVKTSPFT